MRRLTQPGGCCTATGSGAGPLCRHAHRSVARMPSHQPGRDVSRSGRRTSSCSAARYSASIRSSYANAVVRVTGDRAANDRPARGRTVAVAIHAPIGLRSIFAENFGWRGRSLDLAAALFSAFLVGAGFRTILGLYR